jgi:hypothetical protein
MDAFKAGFVGLEAGAIDAIKSMTSFVGDSILQYVATIKGMELRCVAVEQENEQMKTIITNHECNSNCV